MYMLPWKCEAPEQGFEKCNFGHLSGLANCSSKLRVPFIGDPHHKIYVVVVRRQVFKTATLAGGLINFSLFRHETDERRRRACALCERDFVWSLSARRQGFVHVPVGQER